jgi:hypothetical protein
MFNFYALRYKAEVKTQDLTTERIPLIETATKSFMRAIFIC